MKFTIYDLSGRNSHQTNLSEKEVMDSVSTQYEPEELEDLPDFLRAADVGNEFTDLNNIKIVCTSADEPQGARPKITQYLNQGIFSYKNTQVGQTRVEKQGKRERLVKCKTILFGEDEKFYALWQFISKKTGRSTGKQATCFLEVIE